MASIKSIILLAGILAIPTTASSETLYSIGNSLTVDGLTGLTATTNINGYSLDVGTHIRAGAPLNYIRAYPSDVTPGYETPYGTWDYALSNFRFDHVLIQPYLGTGFGTHDTLGSDVSNIQYWIDLAKHGGLANNTEFYIYEAWPQQSAFNGNYQSYWNQPLSDDSNQPMIFAREYFDSAYLALTNHYGDSADIGVIPIGDVISRMDQDIKAGLFPEISDVRQLYRDDVHLGDVGRFVATATIYSALTKTSPENIDLPNWPFATGQGPLVLTPRLASHIGSVVWDVVSHDTRAITPVPLPAAAWLFGSGLLGLGSMARARLRKGQPIAYRR
ncbi:MAG: hypothetical protein E8D42_07490 [Nitrospira sp.]|nr:MAG: hypothetical protein E8D42_07490 [Nitrospira sp.]